MSPLLAAIVTAAATAFARELLLWYDRQLRRRGEKRTRREDLARVEAAEKLVQRPRK